MSGRALLLGVYEDGETTGTKQFTAKCPALTDLIKAANLKKVGKSALFYGQYNDFTNVCVTHLGKRDAGYTVREDLDEGRENVRCGVAAGIKSLKDTGVASIAVDPCGDPEAAAEAAILSLWAYDTTKTKKNEHPAAELYTDGCDASASDLWRRGVVAAEGQNLARLLMESPANVMTPTRFAEVVQERIGPIPNCTVTVRDQAWAEGMKMGSFLSVARGSDEPLRFVEVEYGGAAADQAPVALVGKGITFDSGGISIKPSASMDEMRADCGGGSCVVGAVYAAATLGLKINLRAFVPLCENMPSAHATKPGDVVTAMNGKTIQVDNTDAEGRLILADALLYAQTFKPRAIVDMATLTGAIMVALGAGASAAFTNSNELWDTIHKAGQRSGDRVWRMPLYSLYQEQMTECLLADINNLGNAGRCGGSCTAAAFLQEFVELDQWMHMDIAGVMTNKSEQPYLCKGMSGRPTRTVVEFLRGMILS